MISVSGKNWEEEKFNKRIINKIKVELNLNELIARDIVLKKFDDEELYSLNDDLNLINPFSNVTDFKKAVKLLDESIQNKDKICIIGDYDVDGCISTSLIVKLLNDLKASCFYHIPNRFKDGYGSSVNLLKKIISKKPDLVIMVDNGSNSYEAINFLNENNIKSLVIDHHEIYKPYPKTNILINPKKISEYSKFDYFSTGVLTYFLLDLFIKKKKIKINFSKNLYLVLLTIVADVMPLRKINRIIANKVLKYIDLKDIYFFKKIFDIKKINKPVDIDDFGFLFAPIINSAGRIDDPNIVVRLFTSENKYLNDKIINKLILLNEKRKKIVETTIEKLDLKKINNDKNKIIILENNNINEGIIGIIASNIKTHFNKPSVVITKSENIYKGSARSTKDFPIGKYIKNALDNKLLESGGGHNLAAGFTVKKEKIEFFKKFLYDLSNKNYNKLNYKYLSKISLNAIGYNLLSHLKKIEPYGEENLRPFFLIENIKIIQTKILKKKFISCFIKNRNGKLIKAVSFDFLDSELSLNILNNKNEVNIIVQIKENFWNNKKHIQVIIMDILPVSNKA